MKKTSIYIIGFIVIGLFSFTNVFAKDGTFSQAELDQMTAPIALYPDALLSQILMASTYPDEVAEAAKWSKANSDKKGDDAVKAVQDEQWDASVMSLVAFPQVLDMMGKKPEWVRDLGDAFLVTPDKVMDTIQNLRNKAKEEGNLKSSDEMTVETEKEIIIIESSSPEKVYVPVYNPTYVYGSWWWASYPPYYYYPPGYSVGSGIAAGIGFGIGIIIADSLWGRCDWRRHDINIDINRYNNININKLDIDKKVTNWKHDKDRRSGTANSRLDGKNQNRISGDGQKLKDQKLKDTKVKDQKIKDRENFRGRDQQREKAAQSLKDRGIDPAGNRKALTGSSGDKIRNNIGQNSKNLQSSKNHQSSRDLQKSLNRRSDNHSLSGVNKSRDTSRQINRGVSSERAIGRSSSGFGGGGLSGGANRSGGGLRGRR